MLSFLTTGTIGSGFVVLALLVLFLYLAVIFAAMGLAAAMYILQGLGLQKLASNRGLQKSWLAWIPVANMWLLGCVSDQYRYVAKGKVTNRRKKLLVLMIAYFALNFTASTQSFVLGFTEGMETTIALPGFLSVFFTLLMIPVGIVATVYEYISLYDLYVSANPKKATKYLLLSIFIVPTIPFLIFRCRNQEAGMPPRKGTVQPEAIPAPEVVTEEGFAAAEEFEEDPAETVTVTEEIEVTEEVTETDFAEEQETNQPTEE